MSHTVLFKRHILIGIFTLLCFAFLGCESKEPIKIGFIGGTSGRVADLGISGLDAVQMAVEECNKKGGIGGRKILLIAKDDRQDPDAVRKAVRDLIAEGVAAVIGPMTSDMGIVVAPILKEAKILNVSPTVTTQRLSGIDDYFFRVSSTTREYAGRNAAYHLSSGDMHRIAATYDGGNRSFTKNWLENFKAPFTKGGGEIVGAIEFNREKNQPFSEIVDQLLAFSPDGILIIANSMDSALLCQQIRKADSKIGITLADWGATERLLELGGKAVEGVTVIQTYDRNSPNPKYQAFRKKYIEQYHREPGFPGVYAYDATRVVLEALKTRKKGESLKETVLSIRRFDGLQGPFQFDEYGDVLKSNASISIVRNRKFVVLE